MAKNHQQRWQNNDAKSFGHRIILWTDFQKFSTTNKKIHRLDFIKVSRL